MAAVTLRQVGGLEYPVIRGSITMPRFGAWSATLHLPGTAVKPAGKVEIKAGPLTLAGTVNRAGGLDAGRLRVRVVAGGDGLRKLAKPKHYTSPVIRLPLEDLLRDAGEALSKTAETAITLRTILSWTTVGIETGAMIASLIEVASTMPELAAVDLAWRMLSDGTLWVGRETWPASSLKEYRVIDDSPEDGVVVLGVLLPEVVPGTTAAGFKVDSVEHVVTPEDLRTKIWVAP